MKKNQNGFSALEILIVIVIAGLLGTAGWLVYDRQKSNKDGRETAQTNQQEDPKKDEQAFFEIKELGVKFESSKAPTGLYYHIGNDGKTAYFSLEDLKNTDCAADKTAQVALSRYTDEDFASEETEALKGQAKKIGDFYYFSSGGQAKCSDDDAIQDKASKLRAEITQLLPNALVQIQ